MAFNLWGNSLGYLNNNQRQSPFQAQGQNPHLRGFAQTQTREQRQQNRMQQFQNQPQQQQQFQQQPQQQPQQQQFQQQPINQRQPQQQQFQQRQQAQQQRQPMNQRQQQPQQQPQQQTQQPQQPVNDPNVTFEPLTDDVLKLLGSGKQGSIGSAEPANPADFADIPKLDDKPALSKKAAQMGQILQNERNSAAFYNHMAELGAHAKNERLADLFMQMGDRSQKRADSFREMFRKYDGMEFSTADKPIYKSNNLNEGIKFAIREESDSINEIAALYDCDIDDRFAKELNAALYRKISDLGRLIGI